MNSLIFTEGGQPAYIDDLKLLQQNTLALSQALFSVVVLQDKACLLQPYKAVYLELKSDLSRTIEVSPGTLVYDGMLCPFDGATITITEDNPVYVCLRRTLTDERVFENGQRHYCQERWSAYLSNTKSGAEKYWRLDRLKSYIELLALTLKSYTEKEIVKCSYFNGYTGTFTVKQQPEIDNAFFTIDLSTANQVWQHDTVLGQPGMICKIDNLAYTDLLAGHHTPSFQIDGRKYHLFINLTGVVFLFQGDFGAVSEIPPKPIPVSITFSLKDLL